MLLGVHIIVALASLISSGLAFAAPSPVKLRASYELGSLTLVSGTYLVLHAHEPLAKSCVTGLVYLAVVGFLIFSARRKLASEEIY